MNSLAFTTSVFERLCQDNTENSQDIVENIRLNLNALFNTRQFSIGNTANSDGLTALTYYGLPEITTINTEDTAPRNLFLETLTKQIKLYEPRLQHVNIKIAERPTTSPRQLELIIETELKQPHDPHPLIFRSALNLSTYIIQLEPPYAERISGTLS